MASPKRKRREVLPRREEVFQNAAVHRHNASVGRLIWHWNRLHAVFAQAFLMLVTPEDARRGLAVWHPIFADSGQRDMLSASIEYSEEVEPDLAPRAIEAFIWMLSVVKTLAQHRNDIAHTPMSQSIDFIAREFIVVPEPLMSKPTSAGRLSRAELRKFHALLKGDLIQLFHYGRRALDEMNYPGIGAWPKTPSVLCLPRSEVPLTRSQKDRQQRTQLRRAQMKASQPTRPKQSKRQRRDARIAAAKSAQKQ